jgi:hypothetical protein
LRPVPAKGKYQGCVCEYRQEIPGKRLNLIPPYINITTNDLAGRNKVRDL